MKHVVLTINYPSVKEKSKTKAIEKTYYIHTQFRYKPLNENLINSLFQYTIKESFMKIFRIR